MYIARFVIIKRIDKKAKMRHIGLVIYIARVVIRFGSAHYYFLNLKSLGLV